MRACVRACVCDHVCVCVCACDCLCVCVGGGGVRAHAWVLMPVCRSMVQYSFTLRKPEGSLGQTAQDGHLDSHTASEL